MVEINAQEIKEGLEDKIHKKLFETLYWRSHPEMEVPKRSKKLLITDNQKLTRLALINTLHLIYESNDIDLSGAYNEERIESDIISTLKNKYGKFNASYEKYAGENHQGAYQNARALAILYSWLGKKEEEIEWKDKEEYHDKKRVKFPF